MNQQQQLISGMLNKTNLLQILRTATVFMNSDAGSRIKAVCRYQQFRAANKIIERLRNGTTAEEKSGVVWHTQGSGHIIDIHLLNFAGVQALACASRTN